MASQYDVKALSNSFSGKIGAASQLHQGPEIFSQDVKNQLSDTRHLHCVLCGYGLLVSSPVFP
jgi:hypothetical protein